MRVYISFGLPIVLLTIAFWFIIRQYRIMFINWHKELSVKKIALYSGQIIVKTVVVLLLIILIHNRFHEDQLLEVLLFVGLLFTFAIVQSAYSFSGFVARIHYIYRYASTFFKRHSETANEMKDKYQGTIKSSYSYLIKLLILIAFIITFLPNITLFVLSNVVYVIVIIGLLLIAALLNNVIYFGLTTLIIFQYDPASISLVDANYLVMSVSFIVLAIGFIVETRMDNRMFFIKAVKTVKSFKFYLGYEMVYESNSIIIYQNVINHYYYFYYRITGLVIVYDSLMDLRETKFLTYKMIQKGTQYLRANEEL
ncbi:hypothetical protein [Candidatus Xianfuyuplasma coldseepsis]|uniref:Uncharacterized protein n=1 Tax=Candidatus Xianfuyuplasma coldseepsis TaxID=2782163 RepID=A0A7L7KQV3_9MOLU|nr:hypothetical protein [Xianfuyuplasma coldseepsis]QMS84596.1 hypothetical protein G4Z02_02130 [Xianfuyuplasma coldseepsis]